MEFYQRHSFLVDQNRVVMIDARDPNLFADFVSCLHSYRRAGSAFALPVRFSRARDWFVGFARRWQYVFPNADQKSRNRFFFCRSRTEHRLHTSLSIYSSVSTELYIDLSRRCPEILLRRDTHSHFERISALANFHERFKENSPRTGSFNALLRSFPPSEPPPPPPAQSLLSPTHLGFITLYVK